MSQKKPPYCSLHTDTICKVVSNISAETLTKAYQRDLGIDVSSDIPANKTLVLCQCPICKLQFFSHAEQGSAEFYAKMKQLPWYYPNSKFEYNSAAKWLKNDSKVLDIGCGDGRFSRFIPQCHYTGLEPHTGKKESVPKQIHIVKDTLNAHALQYREHYHAVCSFQVLEHVKNPAVFIQQALQCLQPGGLLIIGVPNATSYLSQLVNFTLNAPPHHLSWWQKETFIRWAADFDLTTKALNESTVEDWEKRLYWMAKVTQILSMGNLHHFSEQRRWQIFNVVAYLSAALLQYIPIKKTIKGSTLLWVAQKPEKSVF